jgi:FixJ family two-component response regulator
VPAAIALRRHTRPGSLSIVYEAGLSVKPLPKVFVVDDDPTVLSSIEGLLTAQSYDVRCFPSAEEFIAQHHPNQVGCVIVDLSSPEIGGAELISHLYETRSLLSVVIISGLIDSAIPHRHEKKPVPKLVNAYEVWILFTMIEDAIAGSLRRNLALMQSVTCDTDRLNHYETNLWAKEVLKLSVRQRQVLSFLLTGDALKEVAKKLELSEHTVGDYVKQIYKHFSVSSRAALLALFIPRGQC